MLHNLEFHTMMCELTMHATWLMFCYHLAVQTNLDNPLLERDYAVKQIRIRRSEPAASRFILQCATCLLGVVFLAYHI